MISLLEASYRPMVLFNGEPELVLTTLSGDLVLELTTTSIILKRQLKLSFPQIWISDLSVSAIHPTPIEF